MLGYIPGLLNGFEYLCKIVDLSGDNLTLSLLGNIIVLEAPYRLTVDVNNTFSGVILTVGSELLVVEDFVQKTTCSLRGVKVISYLLVFVIIACNVLIPSKEV